MYKVKIQKLKHVELFEELVQVGKEMRYNNMHSNYRISDYETWCSIIPVKTFLETQRIIEFAYEDYFLMALKIFKHFAFTHKIGVWARGAMPSSIVCYSMGLTEVDPLKYGLHSARFINDDEPKFQFDIEASRFDEFMEGAEKILQSHANDYDIDAIRKSLFYNIMPANYLSKRVDRDVPKNIDDELARYALTFPDTKYLYKDYFEKGPQKGPLIYQEQMMDILRKTFKVSGEKANEIRRSIQRGEQAIVEAYKKEIFDNLDGINLTKRKAENAWQRLTSNPHAFLKAHAVSQILAGYKYDCPWSNNFKDDSIYERNNQ